MAKPKKNATKTPPVGLARQLAGKFSDLVEPYVSADSVRQIASKAFNRAQLVRAVLTGKYPDLKSLDDSWPVTKRQMLVAHEMLMKDMLTLRTRLDRVMHSVDSDGVAANQNQEVTAQAAAGK